MGRKASLSVAQRTQVVALSKMKLSKRQITKTCKVSKTAVQNAINKFKKEGTFADKKRTGRPSEKRLMMKVVTRSSMTSAEKIRSQLQEDVELVQGLFNVVCLPIWTQTPQTSSKATSH